MPGHKCYCSSLLPKHPLAGFPKPSGRNADPQAFTADTIAG